MRLRRIECAEILTIGIKYELRREISNNVVSATSKCSDQPAHTRSLIRAFATLYVCEPYLTPEL